jgi:GNAT superfamily N-acetyltransferase
MALSQNVSGNREIFDMFNYFVLGYYMAKEASATGELGALFKRQVCRNRLVTPVEMDLTAPLPEGGLPANSEFRFVELDPGDIRAGKWTFSIRSRGIKALRNIKREMRGFALVREDKIIGDVWCVVPLSGKPANHPDLTMLGLICKDGEAYAFDMLIDPTYRGKNLAVPFQRNIQRTLKDEGFVKVYGAYYDDNLPALWMHRMLRFKELPKRKVSRFFIFSKADNVVPKNLSVKSTQNK